MVRNLGWDRRAGYPIREVSRLTGVPAPTLRAWERRYGVPRPIRTSSAYRMYTEDDLETVRHMRKLCNSGMPAAKAATEVLASRIASASAPPFGPQLLHPHEAATRRIVEAVRSFDVAAIELELDRATLLGSAVEWFDRIIAPAMEQVGEEWHRGTMTVAQEHLLTQSVETTLRTQLRMLQPPGDAPLVLLACLENEPHVVGLLGAATVFASHGARVTVLGARTPASAVAASVASLRPALVGLSVTIAPSHAKEVLADYARAVGRCPWILGGAGAKDLAALAQEVGANLVVSKPDWHAAAITCLRSERLAKRTSGSKRTRSKKKAVRARR